MYHLLAILFDTNIYSNWVDWHNLQPITNVFEIDRFENEISSEREQKEKEREVALHLITDADSDSPAHFGNINNALYLGSSSIGIRRYLW